MGCSLAWRPVVKETERLSHEFKCAVQRKWPNNTILSYSDIGYLEGLRDAGHKDAETLLDAISEHGEIEIVWEC